MPISRIPHHDLADHERVAEHVSFLQQSRDDWIDHPEVIRQQ
jgi:hypothetical protein